MNVVASQYHPGEAPRYDAVSLDFAATPQGKYVEVKLASPDCLQLSEVEIFGYSIRTPPLNLARQAGVQATQSSTCWNGHPWRAVDGNTNGNWGSNTITHTCGGGDQWWMLDLGAVKGVEHVVVYNRWDECCRNRLHDSEVQILDQNGAVIASQPIINGIRMNDLYFASGTVGRYVRFQKNANSDFTLAEVQVWGWG